MDRERDSQSHMPRIIEYRIEGTETETERDHREVSLAHAKAEMKKKSSRPKCVPNQKSPSSCPVLLLLPYISECLRNLGMVAFYHSNLGAGSSQKVSTHTKRPVTSNALLFDIVGV